MVGPYKIREQLGEGGMGTVYVAEQKEPVRRQVALKVIKPGMDSREIIGRFEAERQTLAMMSHPNIAKVLDGGTTDDVVTVARRFDRGRQDAVRRVGPVDPEGFGQLGVGVAALDEQLDVAVVRRRLVGGDEARSDPDAVGAEPEHAADVGGGGDRSGRCTRS